MYIVNIDCSGNILSKIPAKQSEVPNNPRLEDNVFSQQFWKDENGQSREIIAQRQSDGSMFTTWCKRSPGRPTSGDQPKEQVTTRIDADLKRKAKDAGLNLAEILEKGIRQRINS